MRRPITLAYYSNYTKRFYNIDLAIAILKNNLKISWAQNFILIQAFEEFN
jgi:hypothetical protein